MIPDKLSGEKIYDNELMIVEGWNRLRWNSTEAVMFSRCQAQGHKIKNDKQ